MLEVSRPIFWAAALRFIACNLLVASEAGEEEDDGGIAKVVPVVVAAGVGTRCRGV